MNCHAEVGAALLQNLEQPPPSHRREPMPAAGDDLTAVVDVDVVPTGELALHLTVDAGIGVLDAAQGFVGEHHPEAERVIRRVPLPHGDVGGGHELPGQRGEIQAAWPAARYCDPHGSPSRVPAATLPMALPTYARLCWIR